MQETTRWIDRRIHNQRGPGILECNQRIRILYMQNLEFLGIIWYLHT